MSELRYWIWLATRERLGAKRALALLERFGTPENVYFARDGELAGIPGCPEAACASLADKDLGPARAILEKCAADGVRILTIGDAEYPERLKNIYDPPLTLYVRGRLPAIDEEAAVAVVGTRSCTPYGVRAAERIGFEIAKSGGLVVSGLARGIDSAAARGALRAGGRVVGVLGCGPDVVYPPSNAALFGDVTAEGAIVTEYPPGTEPSGRNFPARNRILSGLSVGVAVVEAPEKSGALITASLALEQGRDVFAVPGNVDAESCRGSNALLRDGAIAATSGWDITECYAHLFPGKLGRARAGRGAEPLDAESAKILAEKELSAGPKRQEHTKLEIDKKNGEGYIDLTVDPESLPPEELAVLGAVGAGAKAADEVITGSGLPAAEALAALTSLEIRGAVTQDAAGRFTSHILIR